MGFDDERLFRAERLALRQKVLDRLVALSPSLTPVSIAETDEALRPIAKSGALCADPTVDEVSVANEQAWSRAVITHTWGVGPQVQEGIIIQVMRFGSSDMAFEAPLTRGPDPMRTYVDAIARLTPANPMMGLLGGMVAPTGAADRGVSICERDGLECSAGSRAWLDRRAAVAACLQGEDEASVELLVETTGGTLAQCEIAGVDRPEQPVATREACLCAALGGSAARAAKAGRRSLTVGYQAPELTGKVRPTVRLIEASGNLRARDAFDYQTRADGVRSAVTYLGTPGLTRLATSLARCQAASGASLTAALTVSPTGETKKVTVAATDGGPPVACVERALVAGRFTCTTDAAAALVRVAVDWPTAPADPLGARR
jgi:hypothetical protein